MSALTAKITSQPMDTASQVIGATIGTTVETLKAVFTMPTPKSNAGLMDWAMAGFLTMITTIIMKLAAAVFVVVASCTYIATALMSMVSLKLVMALAPVMVPFLIFKPTAWLFDSWLKFLLGACMIKLVGAFMYSLTYDMMNSMNSIAKNILEDTNANVLEIAYSDLLLHSVLVFVALLSALLMAQVPAIASGILSGGAGGAGFNGLKAATGSVGARAAGAVGAVAGRAAWDKSIGERLAARRGAADAQQGFSSGGKHEGSRRSSNAYQRANAARAKSDERGPG
jgi:type IV secretory pathway VirB6-like protein